MRQILINIAVLAALVWLAPLLPFIAAMAAFVLWIILFARAMMQP